MRRRYRPTSLALTCALLALQVSIARAQQPTDTAAAAPPADTTARKTLGDLPVYLTGYITTSYIYDFGNTGDRITGRFYDRFHDTFIPNALRLGIEKLAATDKVDIGVRFELLFGTDAEVTQALVDDGTFNLGRYGDLTEAYITVNAPLGDENHYVQFKAGKMWTLMGFEVIDDVLAYLRFVQDLAREAKAAGLTPLDAARQADLGGFKDLLDAERIVGNLHRAYLELDQAERGAEVDLVRALGDMIAYNGGQPLTCHA